MENLQQMQGDPFGDHGRYPGERPGGLDQDAGGGGGDGGVGYTWKVEPGALLA